MDVRGKTAVVTGASAGIGRAMAVALAARGANAALLGRRMDHLSETSELIRRVGGSAMVYKVDLHDAVATQEVAARMLGDNDRVGVMNEPVQQGILSKVAFRWQVGLQIWKSGWRSARVKVGLGSLNRNCHAKAAAYQRERPAAGSDAGRGGARFWEPTWPNVRRHRPGVIENA
jgi:NAD(P)-dependent dehydrogenase (short-subunit alcohol dehydrogenase family)